MPVKYEVYTDLESFFTERGGGHNSPILDFGNRNCLDTEYYKDALTRQRVQVRYAVNTGDFYAVPMSGDEGPVTLIGSLSRKPNGQLPDMYNEVAWLFNGAGASAEWRPLFWYRDKVFQVNQGWETDPETATDAAHFYQYVDAIMQAPGGFAGGVKYGWADDGHWRTWFVAPLGEGESVQPLCDEANRFLREVEDRMPVYLLISLRTDLRLQATLRVDDFFEAMYGIEPAVFLPDAVPPLYNDVRGRIEGVMREAWERIATSHQPRLLEIVGERLGTLGFGVYPGDDDGSWIVDIAK